MQANVELKVVDPMELLIQEARAHGRTLLEREQALATMERAGKSTEDAADEILRLNEKIAMLQKTEALLRDEVKEAGERQLEAIAALRDLSEQTRRYASGRPTTKKSQSPEPLLAACRRADAVANKAKPF